MLSMLAIHVGVTDIRGHFHPACFMLTSHETQTDFKYQPLLNGLLAST